VENSSHNSKRVHALDAVIGHEPIHPSSNHILNPTELKIILF
jgi:hypothetical protein